MEEVFGPLLDELAEGNEIEDAGVDIDDGEGRIEVVEEMVYFLDDEVLDVLPLVGIVLTSIEIEEVGGGLVGLLEDVAISYMLVVVVEDAFHALVEDGIVIGEEGLVTDVGVDQLASKWFSTHY